MYVYLYMYILIMSPPPDIYIYIYIHTHTHLCLCIYTHMWYISIHNANRPSLCCIDSRSPVSVQSGRPTAGLKSPRESGHTVFGFGVWEFRDFGDFRVFVCGGGAAIAS